MCVSHKPTDIRHLHAHTYTNTHAHVYSNEEVQLKSSPLSINLSLKLKATVLRGCLIPWQIGSRSLLFSELLSATPDPGKSNSDGHTRLLSPALQKVLESAFNLKVLTGKEQNEKKISYVPYCFSYYQRQRCSCCKGNIFYSEKIHEMKMESEFGWVLPRQWSLIILSDSIILYVPNVSFGLHVTMTFVKVDTVTCFFAHKLV